MRKEGECGKEERVGQLIYNILRKQFSRDETNHTNIASNNVAYYQQKAFIFDFWLEISKHTPLKYPSEDMSWGECMAECEYKCVCIR